MKAIRHTGIVVKDLKRALHFYRNLLGLKIVKQMKEAGEFISKISRLKNVKVTTIKLAADENSSLIELLFYYSPPKRKIAKKEVCNLGISHIAFTVKDIEKEYKRLTKVGVKFNSLPQVSTDGYAKVVFCRDFENNLIELVEVL